ncbi:MAG: IS30 family transposase [Faecousia sp.]
MSYTHFTLDERKYLQKLLSEDQSIRSISRILGRAPSTISREIRRNKTKYKPRNKPDNKYWYNHWRANTLYILRRRNQARAALKPGTEEWDYIVSGLEHYWSPAAIAGRWHLEHPDRKPLCVSTIYRYIRQGKFPKITAKSNLRRRGKHMLPRSSSYNSIQPDRIIPQWPDAIRGRTRIGDWEGDTVYGGIGKGLLVTLVDRKSRYLKMGLLPSRDAAQTRKVIKRLLSGLTVKSISLDNGSEFSEFRKLEEDLSTLVYFAEPHKPWQRGTNENTNDIVRFFFPKGFDFRTITDEDVQFVEDLINNRPRACLNWKTSAEVFFSKTVALD